MLVESGAGNARIFALIGLDLNDTKWSLGRVTILQWPPCVGTITLTSLVPVVVLRVAYTICVRVIDTSIAQCASISDRIESRAFAVPITSGLVFNPGHAPLMPAPFGVCMTRTQRYLLKTSTAINAYFWTRLTVARS